jgi:hypothetical protein
MISDTIMSCRLRSQKEVEYGIEQVFEIMVKGMRNEMNKMNTVVWKIECSRDT